MEALEDVRIIAVEQYGAGPFGTLHLADHGAEVIKIEDPRHRGDVARYVPPYQAGEDSLFFESFNRNKRSLSLDLATAGGRKVLEDLVVVSDAVYSNLRGDVPAALGLRYEDLKHLNPSIVCCSLSGFGMTGPRANEPAYDYIVQGLAGWMSLTGEPDGPPEKTGLSLVDYSGGLAAANALLIGVHAARRDGQGMDCDISLFDCALGLLTYVATWHLTEGFEPQRTHRSAHPSLVPFQNFPTADGWIVVGCAKQKFFEALVEAIGHPELSADERFKDFSSRSLNVGMLVSLLDEVFVARPTAHWIGKLSAAGVPCGPVNSVADALKDPQAEARGMIVETEHPRFGSVRQVKSPVRVGNHGMRPRRAPRRNEDAPYVLEGLLGYDASLIAELASGGAFGNVDASEARPGDGAVEGEPRAG